MKHLRFAAALLLAAGLIALNLFSQARPARADDCLLGFIPPCLTTGPVVTCDMGNVDVTGDSGQHRYRYTMSCGDSSYTESGVWDVGSNTARESLQDMESDGNSGDNSTTWVCTADPWIDGGASCSLKAESLAPVTVFCFGHGQDPKCGQLPEGVILLDHSSANDARHVLWAQLQNALKADNPLEHLHTLHPLPDLAVRVDGPPTVRPLTTATYKVRLSNNGGINAAGVSLQVLGFPSFLTVQSVSTTVPGQTCTRVGNGGPGGWIVCNDGALTAGQSGEVTIVTQVGRTASAGSQGTIDATGYVGGSIHDADPSNDEFKLTVTLTP